MAGGARLQWNGAKVQALISGACTREVLESAVDLKRESQEEVPVDTGRLRNSCEIEVERRGKRLLARIGYHTEYAIYVHEDMEANHPHGGKAKFLSDPLNRNKEKYRERINRAVKSACKGV